MYGGTHYGQIPYGGQAVYSAPTGVTEDIINSATNTPSLYEPYVEDYLTNIILGTPSIWPDELHFGEENIIENLGENIPSIDDFIISLQDEYTNIGVASQTITESIAESFGHSQINTPYLEAQEDYLTTSAVNTPSIYDIVNGNVTETVDAPGPLSLNDHAGYNVSGVAIHTLLEQDLIDIGEDTGPPQIQFIFFTGNNVYLIYNEVLDPLSVPPTSSFNVDINGTPTTVTSAIIDQNQVILTLSGSTNTASDLEISYTPDGVYPIRDLAHNNAAPFSTYTEDEVEDPETGEPIYVPPPTWQDPDDIPAPTDPHGGQVVPSMGPAGVSLLGVSYRTYSFHRVTGV